MPDKNLQFLDIPRAEPAKSPVEARVAHFREIYAPYQAEEAAQQAGRCLACGNPFCEWKCPVHNYIPNWLKLIEEGNLFEAAELSHKTNSLPEVCGRICPQDRLCEGACTLNDGLGSVTIGAIEKYITDEALKRGWRPDMSHVRPTGRRVAVVGAGPAGLACADILVRSGVQPVVFDRHPRIGGLLTFGIPPFKLEKEVVEKRREIMQGMGVEFRLGLEVGADIAFERLLGEYDAVFLGMGAYRSVRGGFAGEELPGVHEALAYLIANINHELRAAGRGARSHQHARQARGGAGRGRHRHGLQPYRAAPGRRIGHLHLPARRAQHARLAARLQEQPRGGRGVPVQPPADRDRRCRARRGREAGARRASARPMRAAGACRRRAGLRAGRARGCRHHRLRFPAEPAGVARPSTSIRVHDNGRVRVSAAQAQASRPPTRSVFAGGDMVRGSDLVVTAVFEGREAARGILDYLGVG